MRDLLVLSCVSCVWSLLIPVRSGSFCATGMRQVQQQRERVQMQEEAINTAIIQETEEELQQINKSLYKV